MASRGKKKVVNQVVEQAVTVRNTPSKDKNIMILSVIVTVLLLAFLFIGSFNVKVNIDMKDDSGNSLLDTSDPDLFGFGRSAITVLFAPLNGYTTAIDYVIKNLPALADSEISQDIASQYISSYPQSQLDLLDKAFTMIYITEAVYTAIILCIAIAMIVMWTTRCNNFERGVLVLSVIALLASIARIAIAITMYSQSTKEFMLSAGGAIWLSVVISLIAVVLTAVFMHKNKENKDKKVSAK